MAPHHKTIVIGAGVSGLVTLKTLKQLGIDCVIYEANPYHGGLWHFHPDNYGVAEFTYINVSRHHYAFSDFPFPEGPDYAHNTAINTYINDYVEHFNLADHIQYNTRVIKANRCKESGDSKKKWEIICQSSDGGQFSSTCEYLVIATGHHAKPKIPKFKGEENFNGEMIHSVKYKDVRRSGYDGKKVVLIGIGNSSVDIADNLVSKGGCPVQISTRTGTWVFHNYLFGQAGDLCMSRRTARQLIGKKEPLGNAFIKALLTLVQHGHPSKYGLNPKYDPTDTHPTVSPTLIHHIQRGNITIKPDIQEIGEDFVRFTDGSVTNDVDVIIKCTGYTIQLPYLEDEVREMILDEQTNDLKMYHTVFSPDFGKSLAMIGYVQPIGSLIEISEIQAQWLGMLITGRCTLPSKLEMKERIIKDKMGQANYKESTRHTLQRHPLVYCDEIADSFGAKPKIWDHPKLALRLLFGSCGSSQWTLQGPYYNPKAADQVHTVPVPIFNVVTYFGINGLLIFFMYMSIKLFFYLISYVF